ncbi:hypothetical protein JTB14_022750 [Gonioctena quinquepunctata]|nr:hypothetical protein JTB14_022750 [Gonioctena quinquepunctata]
MIEYVLLASVFIFTISRLTCGWCYSKVCLMGKTALITGANSGIGYQTALALASRGCRVIIADVVNATNSRDRIIRKTNNLNIVVKHLDLASLSSVRKLAKDLNETEKRLDILINNAGIGSSAIQYTEDGLQRTMQVNYFGHFLLTHLLLDLLKKSAPSRIIFTSSIAAYITRLDLKHLNAKESNSAVKIYRPYFYSKLCQIVAAKRFAEKLRHTGITSYSHHPGLVRTSIYWTSCQEKFSIWVVICGLIVLLFGKSIEEGAQTMIHLATDPAVEKFNRFCFWDCRRYFFPLQAYNKKFCQDVWESSLKCVKLKPDECII